MSFGIHTYVRLTLLLLLAGETVLAQTAADPGTHIESELTLSSRSELVLIPSLVRDRSGRHVGALKVSDFLVREEGRTQKVSIFEEVVSSAEPLHRRTESGIYTNSFEKPTPRSLVIIAIDLLNSRFLNESWSRRQLITFLNEHVDDNALYVLLAFNVSGVKIIHDATSDPSVLVASLRKVQDSMEGPSDLGKSLHTPSSTNTRPSKVPDEKTVTEAAQITQVMKGAAEKLTEQIRVNTLRATLDALETVGRIYAGVPGRKALVWITDSFPYNPLDQTDYEHTWKVLNDTNLAIYAVDARGVVNPAAFSAEVARFDQSWVMSRSNLHTDTISTLKLFAESTGGRAFYNTNDITGSLQQAASDCGSYYLLGYYRSTKDTAPSWRSLNVAVQRKNVHVRARSGYFVSNLFAAPPRNEMETGFLAPVEFTGLPLVFKWSSTSEETTPGTGDRSMGFDLALLPTMSSPFGIGGNYVRLKFAGMAIDDDGKIKARFAQSVQRQLTPEDMRIVVEHGFAYKGNFELPPGAYTVRVVVQDEATGNMGSVIVPLTVH